MKNIYKITKKGYSGALYVQFKDGKISEALFQIDPFLSSNDLLTLSTYFPYHEEEVKFLPDHGFECLELKARTVSDKIAMFCMSFRTHRNTAYSAKKNEKANVADVTMTPALLDSYFTNNDYPLTYAKSINDYVRHYNYIRDVHANGKPIKTGFHEIYDREYERTLEGEKLSAYWQHLIRLGWSKQDGVWIQGLFKK